MMIQVSGGKMDEKRNQLKEFLLSQGSLAVAFSGGVDSTFLLKVAHNTLGDKCVAVTASLLILLHGRDSWTQTLSCGQTGSAMSGALGRAGVRHLTHSEKPNPAARGI